MTDAERQRLLAEGRTAGDAAAPRLLRRRRLPASSTATAALAANRPVDDEDWRELATARRRGGARRAARARPRSNERVFVAAPNAAGRTGRLDAGKVGADRETLSAR